jgi:hypothetical protein
MLQLAKGLPPVPRTNIPKREGLQVAGMSRVAVIALDRRMNPLAFHTAAGLEISAVDGNHIIDLRCRSL